jgi:hypothetical protein
MRNWRFMLLKLVLPPLVCATLVFSQSNSLPARETFHYNIEWRLFTAGKAKVELTTAPQLRPTTQVNLHLESIGIVSKLFRVEDNYTANMSSGYCVQNLQMTTQEGNRQRETKITFDAETRKASYLERDRARNNAIILAQEIEVPACVHDVIGGLFFIRTLNLEPGQSAQIPVSDGKKSVMVKVEAQAREDVKTPLGTFKTMRYEVYLFDGVLYKRSAHVNLWISDDRRKLPVQIRVRMTFTIGTINLQLEKYE